MYQIISWKNGQPYRVRGNEVQAVTVGDIIETHIGPRF